jgi:hypothetical protein
MPGDRAAGPLPGGPAGGGQLAALAVAAMVAVLTMVWSAGELSGWLAHGSWPTAPAPAGVAAFVRLPAHLAHSRRAWPISVRRQLGPAPLLWAILAVEAASAGAAMLVGWRCWRSLAARTPAFCGRARPGLAGRAELGRALSARTRRHQASRIRPSLGRRR